jgi:hypothetical protein
MSITITTDVFCDRCSDWVHGTTGPRPDAWTARLSATRMGWSRIKEDGKLKDICPNCNVKEYK